MSVDQWNRLKRNRPRYIRLPELQHRYTTRQRGSHLFDKWWSVSSMSIWKSLFNFIHINNCILWKDYGLQKVKDSRKKHRIISSSFCSQQRCLKQDVETTIIDRVYYSLELSFIQICLWKSKRPICKVGKDTFMNISNKKLVSTECKELQVIREWHTTQ